MDEKPPKREDWPLWHFAGFSSAIERNDLEAAAKAQRELRRLGIEVRLMLDGQRKEAGHA